MKRVVSAIVLAAALSWPARCFSATVTILSETFEGSYSPAVSVTETPGVNGPPTITSPGSALAELGIAFTYLVTATGTAPLTFTVDMLPPGLFVTSGGIVGTPTAMGSFTTTITVANSLGNDTIVLVIAVDRPGKLQDTDNDVTMNLDELAQGTNPINPVSKPGGAADFDGDGILDYLDVDDDGDGFSDAVEFAAGTGLYDRNSNPGPLGDIDGDALVNEADPDDDGDGFSDAMEEFMGTVGTDMYSNPFGYPVTPTALSVQKMQVKLNFASASRDGIAFSGLLPVPAGFNASGRGVIVCAGGVVTGFALNSKGASPPGNATFKIRLKAKNRVVIAQLARYSVKLKAGHFAAELSDDGFDNADIPGAGRSVSVEIMFNSAMSQVDKGLFYRAKAGKSGSAK